MVLVLLGTFPTPFPRPLQEIEKLCEQGIITEEVIVQNGHTIFESSHLTMTAFIAPDELTELYQKAKIIISHAGTGSVVKGVKMGKRMIVVARLAKYGEMVDDHQIELLDNFSELGYIIPWHETDSLSEILKVAESFKPASYLSKKEIIISHLEDYINSL